MALPFVEAVVLPSDLAWIESLTGVYKSACCRAASLFLLFSPLFAFPPLIERSIEPRLIVLQKRDPRSGLTSVIGANVGHTCVSPRSARNDDQLSSLLLIYCRSPDRGYYNHEEILHGYLWSVFATSHDVLRSTREEVSKLTDSLILKTGHILQVLSIFCSRSAQSRCNRAATHLDLIKANRNEWGAKGYREAKILQSVYEIK